MFPNLMLRNAHIQIVAAMRTYIIGTISAFENVNKSIVHALSLTSLRTRCHPSRLTRSRAFAPQDEGNSACYSKIRHHPHPEVLSRSGHLGAQPQLTLEGWCQSPSDLLPANQLSKNDRSFRERLGCLSLRRAFASIWRIRSRVTENCWPTSSSV